MEKSKNIRIGKLIIISVLTIAYISYFVENWELTVLLIHDIKNIDFSALEYFGPLILFPIGIYGFIKVKRYGWIILTILLLYSIFTVSLFIINGIIDIFSPPVVFKNEGIIQMQEVENSALNELFGFKDILFYIFQFIIRVSFLFFLNKKAILEEYMISRKIQILVMNLTIIPLVILGVIFFW